MGKKALDINTYAIMPDNTLFNQRKFMKKLGGEMTCKMMFTIRGVLLILMSLAAITYPFTVQAGDKGSLERETIDAETLEQLQSIIEQQQAQIDAQAKAIRELSVQVKAISEQPAHDQPFRFVKSDNKADLKLYGQINRALLYADDGDDGEVYHVDNEASDTRIGLLGTIKDSEDLSLGARFEVNFISNGTYSVNQTDESVGGKNFSGRHMDIYITSKKFGKLSLGQGNTASNGTSEVTFSDTWLASNVNVDDMAGGILFFNNDTNTLTTTSIDDVYSAMDGLGRKERVRYDTPSFGGFKLSASAVEEDAEDIALTYNGELSGVKFAGAIAYANLGNLSSSTDHQINGSLAIMHESGFNVTFAKGHRDMADSSRNNASFAYFNIGYKGKFLSIGQTAFSLDYGNYENLSQNRDDADSFGLQFVQKVNDWGTEFYLGYRNHRLVRPGFNYDDINTFMAGGRLKF